MPAQNFRCQVALQHDSGLPEDVTTNTWYFHHADGATGGINFLEHLADFYQTFNGVWSKLLNGVGRISTYDMADPEPRVPYVTEFGIGMDDDALPSEVAICMSYGSPASSGSNAARRRGRLFLGPWGTSALNASDGRPVQSLCEDIRDAATALVAALAADTEGWRWALYSPTDDVFRIIDHGWVDNEFDTQRSRGLRPTTRYTFG